MHSVFSVDQNLTLTLFYAKFSLVLLFFEYLIFDRLQRIFYLQIHIKSCNRSQFQFVMDIFQLNSMPTKMNTHVYYLHREKQASDE